MSFEQETLTRKNMQNNEALVNEPSVVEKNEEVSINTKEFAQKALKEQEAQDRLKEQDTVELQKTREAIGQSQPEQVEKKEAAEAREVRLKDFVSKAYDLVINDIQRQHDQTGLAGLFNTKGVKKEMEIAMDSLNTKKKQDNISLNPDYLFAGNTEGRFASSKVKKEINAMINQLAPEDQEILRGSKKQREQSRYGMSDVSQG